MMTNPSPRSCNQAAEVPSSKVTDKLPCSPWRNSRIVAAFVSRILSMINLPRESKTATEIVAWWTSMPIYFSWLITALLSVGGDANNHNLQQSGRLLYCVTWRFTTHRGDSSEPTGKDHLPSGPAIHREQLPEATRILSAPD